MLLALDGAREGGRWATMSLGLPQGDPVQMSSGRTQFGAERPIIFSGSSVQSLFAEERVGTLLASAHVGWDTDGRGRKKVGRAFTH